MPNYSGLPTTYNTFINANDSTAKERLGTYRFVDERVFMYVHAEEALIAGNTAQTSAEELVNADVDSYDATTKTLTATGDFSGKVVIGGYVYFDANTGIGQIAKIDGQTDNTIHLQNPLDTSATSVFIPDGTSPDATTDYIIFSGVDARKADAGEDVQVGGVAQAALTADYYGWLQLRGIGLGLIDGSESAVVLGSGVVNGGAVAGTIEGFASGEEENIFAIGLVDLGATDDTVPIDLHII